MLLVTTFLLQFLLQGPQEDTTLAPPCVWKQHIGEGTHECMFVAESLHPKYQSFGNQSTYWPLMLYIL